MFATLERSERAAPGWTQTARLVERAQDGDREAFGQLAEQFQHTVYAICLGRLGNPSEALEMTQDVFLHAMRQLDQLREPERFAGWLKQMTHRMAINRATRRVPPTPIEDEVLHNLGAEHDDPLDTLIARERARKLWEALGELKPLDRETLVDFYIQGQSLLEISDRLDVPVGTVKRRLHTARLRLRAELESRSSDAGEWIDGLNEVDVSNVDELAFAEV